MGLKVVEDIDTEQGGTRELYVRIESLVINKGCKSVTTTVSYWIDQLSADNSKQRNEGILVPKGQVSGHIVSYKHLPYGEDVELPFYFVMELTDEAMTTPWEYCYTQIRSRISKLLGPGPVEIESI